MTLLLGFLTYQTTKKALQLHRKEIAEKERIGGEHDDPGNLLSGKAVDDAREGEAMMHSNSSANSNHSVNNNKDSTDDPDPKGEIQPFVPQDGNDVKGKELTPIVIGGKTFMLGENG